MSALARSLVPLLATVLALAVGVPTALLIHDARVRRAERLDVAVAAATRDVLAVVGETRRGELDVDTYVSTPRSDGAPRTAVVDPTGALEAGDRELSADVRAAAVRALRAGDDEPRTVGTERVAVRPIEGATQRLGGAVAFQSLAPLRAQDRSALLRGLALAVGGWALLLGAATWGCARLLRPVEAAARREQAFLADAGHELRTPWAIVAARAAQARREDGQVRTHLQAIEHVALTAGATIGDMLELARLEAGRALSDRVPVDLDALLLTACDERADAARAAGVKIDLDTPGRTVVAADPGLVGRAVGNLLDNALRHGAAGGRVDVRMAAGDGEVSIAVSDRGRGVAPAQRERIFERYARAAHTATPGAGLGLPIARLIARAHGGTLVLDVTAAGPGARFVLRLPA